jgi:hypothetical protein
VSDTWLPEFKWSIQGNSFAYPARVLPLKSFDMILGSDWLEDHSPTWIHWKKRQMCFPLHGSRVLIKGINDDITSCKAISSGKFKGLLRRKAITHCVELRPIHKSFADHSIHEVSSANIVENSPSGVPEAIQKLV